jgi:hypothetical protein
MVPYWVFSDRGILSEPTDEKKMRPIALAYIDADLMEGQRLEILQRGKRVEGIIVKRHLSGEAPPYARPILIEEPKKKEVPTGSLKELTTRLVTRVVENTHWRREETINLDLPAVVTVLAGSNTPRTPKAVQIMKAHREGVLTRWTPQDLGLDENSIGSKGSCSRVVEVF